MTSPNFEKPTIFIFSTAYLPMVGGAELAIKEITDRLSDYFDFVLFTSRFKRSLLKLERVGAVEVHRLGFGTRFDKYFLPVFGYLKARQVIKNYELQTMNYKLLLWGMMASYGSIAVYFLKRRNPGLKFLLTLQEGDPEEYLVSGRLGLMGFWFKKIVSRADRVQVISKYLGGLAIKLGADKEAVDIVPNGADIEVFGRGFPAEELRNLRLRYGFNSKSKAVITASRLVRKNALDVVIKAVAEISEAHFFVAGTGSEEKSLRRLAQKLNIQNRVHFLGNLSHDELARYYAISHVFVRPSRSEGLGSAFLEAMAAGLPVIGTRVGGIPDILQHNFNGLFCEVDDIEDLILKMKRFLHDLDFGRSIGANAKRFALENYSWDKIAQKMSAIFFRLLRP